MNFELIRQHNTTAGIEMWFWEDFRQRPISMKVFRLHIRIKRDPPVWILVHGHTRNAKSGFLHCIWDVCTHILGSFFPSLQAQNTLCVRWCFVNKKFCATALNTLNRIEWMRNIYSLGKMRMKFALYCCVTRERWHCLDLCDLPGLSVFPGNVSCECARSGNQSSTALGVRNCATVF